MKRAAFLCFFILLFTMMLKAEIAEPLVVVEETIGYTLISIQVIPGGASLLWDGFYAGFAPLERSVPAGEHVITVQRTGYKQYDLSLIILKDSTTTVTITLEPETAFLILEGAPENVELFVDGTGIPAQKTAAQKELVPGGNPPESGKTYKIPTGKRNVLLKAFGYEDRFFELSLESDQSMTMDGSMAESPFRITGLRLSRSSFSPRNKGELGSTSLSWQVSRPGLARIVIKNTDGTIVLERNLEPFERGRQSIRWDGRDEAGDIVSDGRYEISLVREDALETEASEAVLSLNVTVDSRRSFLESASVESLPGLSLIPAAFALPSGAWRVSLSVGADLSSNAEAFPDATLALVMSPVQSVNLGTRFRFLPGEGMFNGEAALSWAPDMPVSLGMALFTRASSQAGKDAVTFGAEAGGVCAFGHPGLYFSLSPAIEMIFSERADTRLVIRSGLFSGDETWSVGLSVMNFSQALESGWSMAFEPRIALEASLRPRSFPLSLLARLGYDSLSGSIQGSFGFSATF